MWSRELTLFRQSIDTLFAWIIFAHNQFYARSQNCEKRLLASPCLSVHPSVRYSSSVRMEQLSSQRTDFHEIWYLRIFRKSVQKIQVSLKSNKNNGYFT